MWGVTGCNAGCQEVGRCSTRSLGVYVTFTSARQGKTGPTVALKRIGEVATNPKQGYQGPQNRTHVRQKLLRVHLHNTAWRWHSQRHLTVPWVNGYQTHWPTASNGASTINGNGTSAVRHVNTSIGKNGTHFNGAGAVDGNDAVAVSCKWALKNPARRG